MTPAITNAAAAANTGRHRAATHSTNGNREAAGTTVAHSPGGRAKTSVPVTASATSAIEPSTSSRVGNARRDADARPMSTGARVTIPSASEANQRSQIVSGGAVVWPNNSSVAVAPAAAAPAPMAAARNSPVTCGISSSLNPRPTQRSISQATSRTSPALQTAKAGASQTLRLAMRWAGTVAAATPAATGSRDAGPRTISTPAARPAAGQYTAMEFSDLARRARPSHAAARKAMAAAGTRRSPAKHFFR